MKSFRKLTESLPNTNLVLAICDFDPPSIKHDILIKFISKIAKIDNSEIKVLVPDIGVIPVTRRLHYLSILYPNIEFISSFYIDKSISKLKNEYNSILLISDKVTDQYNIKSISIPLYKKLAEYSSKLVEIGVSGDWNSFKNYIPARMRYIDAQRMMNDIRLTLKLPEIKVGINNEIDDIREQYVNGTLYKLNDLLMIDNQEMKIIKRGTNYVVLEDLNKQTISRFIHDL